MSISASPENSVGRRIRQAGSRVNNFLITLALCALGMTLMFIAVASLFERVDRDTGMFRPFWQIYAVVALGLCILLPIPLFLRHRYPQVTWIIGVTSLVIPVGMPMALTLPSYIRKHDHKQNVRAVILLVVNTALFVIWDLQGPDVETSPSLFLSSLGVADGGAVTHNVPLIAATYLMTIIVPVAIGTYLRSIDSARASDVRATDAQEVAYTLEVQLDNRRSSDKLAQDIHDTLGRQLSLINLYAGGIEISAAHVSPQELGEQARQLRVTAQDAIDGLHELVATIRHGETSINIPDSEEDLRALITPIFEAGHPGHEHVQVIDLKSADPQVRDYLARIVSELLTNSVKHAPNQFLSIEIVGSAETGISVRAINPIAPGTDSRRAHGGSDSTPGLSTTMTQNNYTATNSGRGLSGIRDRIAQLGGRCTIGQPEVSTGTHATQHNGFGGLSAASDNGADAWFQVDLWLPWRANNREAE